MFPKSIVNAEARHCLDWLAYLVDLAESVQDVDQPTPHQAAVQAELVNSLATARFDAGKLFWESLSHLQRCLIGVMPGGEVFLDVERTISKA